MATGVSYLSEKSGFNTNSAQVLLREGLYCSSVHCSYYSCIQLMKHVLLHRMNVKEYQIHYEIDRFRKASNTKGGFHQYIINHFYKSIADIDEDEADIFHSSIQDLKFYRERSDYEDKATLVAEGQQAFKIAKKVIGKINDFYL